MCVSNKSCNQVEQFESVTVSDVEHTGSISTLTIITRRKGLDLKRLSTLYMRN